MAGLKVLEVASLGPGPFCAMMLADHGADVLRIERPGGSDKSMVRGRGAIELDLKAPEGISLLLRLVGRADALLEGFRPGVAERLGFGPAACHEVNPGLVYGRMTGWGQDGPLADAAGHDINYIGLSGTLGAIGRAGGPPTPPLNLVGDFGGGGLLLAFGVLAALLHKQRTGEGQVVDAAMVDGAALLTTMVHEMLAAGTWQDERGANVLDTGAPFYDVYATSDGGWMAVGAIEPQFFGELVEGTGIDFDPDRQYDQAAWPRLRTLLEEAFGARPRSEWESTFAGRDACVSPVLSLREAHSHPANAARRVFVEHGGAFVPAPAPRFTATPSAIAAARFDPEAWGMAAGEI